MAATMQSAQQAAFERFRAIDMEIQRLAGSEAVGFGQVSQAAVASIETGNRPPDPDRGALVEGPFTFVAQIAAAPIAGNATVADLTTFALATGTGPVSSNLFPTFQAVNGQPDTLLFVNEIKYEVDTDSLGNSASISDLLSSLELSVSVGQGNKVYRRNYALAECSGTVTHASSAATTNAATTLQSQHKIARPKRLMDIPPVFLPTSTFALVANGRGVPIAPTAITPVYIHLDGFCIHNVKNAFDIQSAWTNPTTMQRQALDRIGALVQEKRSLMRAFGFSKR